MTDDGLEPDGGPGAGSSDTPLPQWVGEGGWGGRREDPTRPRAVSCAGSSGSPLPPGGWGGRREVPKIMTQDSPIEHEVDLLLGLVRQRYGNRLTAAELDGVRQGI